MTNLHNVSVCIWHALVARGLLKTLTLPTFSSSLLLEVKALHILTSFYGCIAFRKFTLYFISNKRDPYIHNQIYIKAIFGYLPHEVMQQQ